MKAISDDEYCSLEEKNNNQVDEEDDAVVDDKDEDGEYCSLEDIDKVFDELHADENDGVAKIKYAYMENLESKLAEEFPNVKPRAISIDSFNPSWKAGMCLYESLYHLLRKCKDDKKIGSVFDMESCYTFKKSLFEYFI